MPSSTAIAFRALIMLVFLISVPLLAIFGKDLPEVIKGLIDGRLSVQLTEQPKNGNATPTPSPPATGISNTTANATAPPNNNLSNNPFAETAPYRAAPAAASSPANPISPVNPTTLNPTSQPPTVETVSPSPIINVGMSTPATAQMKPPADWPAAASRPEAFQAPIDSRPIATDLATEPGKPSQATSLGSHQNEPPNDNKFRLAETRLRELGATHYVLETWGPQNERYRFACRMAIGGNVGVNRHFEAVDQDPWRAMEDVLRQVEQWQKQAVQ